MKIVHIITRLFQIGTQTTERKKCMKQRIAYLITICLVLSVGCRRKSNVEGTFMYSDRVEITETEFCPGVEIKKGKMRVFLYERDAVVDSSPDGGYWEAMLFEVDPNLIEFKLTDSELEAAKCTWIYNCPRKTTATFFVKRGTIEGRQNSFSRKYEISIDISVDHDIDWISNKKRLKATFSKPSSFVTSLSNH